MRVLVTGANGFIGSRIVAALQAARHETVAAIRAPLASAVAQRAAVACDMARDIDVHVWTPRLVGIDAVVNCAGILRQTRRDRFQRVQVERGYKI